VACDSQGLYIYLNSDVPECRDCSSNCLKCESNSKCLECQPDMKLVWTSDGQSNSCDACADCDLNLPYDRDCYLYQVNKLNCISNCKLCSNHNQCKKCNDGYFLENGGSCCTKCPESCELCVGEDFCTKCKGTSCSLCESSDINDNEDYYLFGGLCILRCSSFSTYVFSTSLAVACSGEYDTGTEKCMACPPNCVECVTDSIVCDCCEPGYYLLGTNCVPENINSYGYTQINKDGSAYTCEIMNCVEYLACGKCSSCDANFYIRKSDSHSCVACTSDNQKIVSKFCYEISDCGISNCLQCGSPNTCEDNRCASRFFRTAGGHCESCTTGCLVCEDQSACCACDTGLSYKLQESKCVLECHDGFYISGKSSIIKKINNIPFSMKIILIIYI
jgi:hypothetical protein